MFEIASGIGTPLTIDEATLSRVFGLYARVLVDVDMSGRLFDSVLVEREGHAFPVAIEYMRRNPCIVHTVKCLLPIEYMRRNFRIRLRILHWFFTTHLN